MYIVKAKNAADSGWTTIYDSSDKALCLISQPKHSSEMNQPGSFDFTIYPDSDFYDAIVPMNTFISAFEGTDSGHLEETFYGRVLTCEDDFYGIKSVSCEGALSFFKDATVGKVSTDDGDSGREYQTSPQAFLQEQLTAYNAKVEERKKLFYGGTSGITTSSAEIFKIDDDQDFRSILESQLIDVYGGFFKITRLQNGTHELSYVKNYGIDSGTVQTIQIGQNILDKQKHVAGDGVFTFIRPVGKDGARLNDGVYHGVACNSSNGRSGLYPVGTDATSFNALYARYGFIEKAKSFDDCETSNALAGACDKYVRDYGLDALDKLPMTFDVKLVDFFNANPDVKRIELGANYILTVDSEGRETGFEGHADGTPAQEGQEGLTLTVYSINREYDSPENDSITFYNATYLTAKDYSIILSSMTGSYSSSSGGGGSRGGLSGMMTSKDAEEQEKFKRFETFYEETDEKFSWLATDSEWDELSQTGRVTALTQLTRTAHFVEDTAKKELPFEDWKAQWIIAHPEDASLSDTELRAKYNAWIKENSYAIYNTEYSDATRTERLISKTGINELGENETITSRVTQTADRLQSEISSTKSGVYSVVEQTLSGFRQAVSDDVAGYKSEIEQSNNSFKAEIHNTISDIYTRILAWDGGAAIDIRQGNRVFKQFNAPAYTLPDDDTLQAGDIWVKSNDMRTWGEASDKPWGDVNSFHWDDYVGDEIYVWKNGRWQRVLSEKELVVQAHRFQTTLDETWDVIDDTASGLRVEMSRTASHFYQTLTDSNRELSSDIRQQADRISLVVEGTGSNAHIKPASIIAAINEQTGQSQVLIEANQVAVAATDLAVWGVFTDNTLTGGVVAEKLNSGTNTYVSGDRVFIGDISFDFQRVYPSSSTNPAAMDYFEKISNNNYILTKDITPVPGKAYYQRTIGVNAENANDKFTAVDRLIAGKVDTTYLNAHYTTTEELTVDKINIGLNTSKTNVGELMTWMNGSLIVKKPAIFTGTYGDVTINNTKITAKTYQVNSGGVLKFIGSGTGEYYDVSANTVKDFVTGVQVVPDGNNYKLQKKTVYNSNWTDAGNFSRATTLSGAWSGGVFTVTASPQSVSHSTRIYQSSVSGYGTTWNGDVASVPVCYGDDAQHPAKTGYTVTVNASSRYTAGQNSVNVTKGSWSSGIISFTTSAGTGSSKSVQLTQGSASWSGNTASVMIWDGTAADAQHGSQTGYTVTVDASSRYNAGYSDGGGATVSLSVYANWIEADGTENGMYQMTDNWTLYPGEKAYVRAANNGTLGGNGYYISARVPTLTFSWAERYIGSRFRINTDDEDSGLYGYLGYENGYVYLYGASDNEKYARLYVANLFDDD